MPLPMFFTVYRAGEFTLAVGIQTEGTKKPPVGGFTTLLIALIILVFPMVPGAGLEPAQRERRGILNPLCLPIPPSGLGKNWRRVPESNRTRRICNPLHNRFVNAPNFFGFSASIRFTPMLLNWSGKRDSNSRPRPWQGRALPTELFPQYQATLLIT